jgi:polar amino acid transport system permease protein
VPYRWRFDVVLANLPFILQGLSWTVLLAVLCMLLSSVFGMVVALARLSRWRLARGVGWAYTELFRTTPLLVQMIWILYVLPLLTGITLAPFPSGLLALSLNVAAYLAEIYRAGLLSVGLGQRQAALALGMTSAQALRRIVLPQAVLRMIPPIASTWVTIFKDTSVLSAIGVMEVMFRARVVATDTYRPLEIFTVVALIYFLLTYPQSLGVNILYKRLRTQE